MKYSNFIISSFFFKVSWISVIIAAYYNYDILGLIPTMMYCLYFIYTTSNIIKLIILVLFGVLLDSINIQFGLYSAPSKYYSAPLCPFWIVFLWVNFSVFMLQVYNNIVNNIFNYFIILGLSGTASYYYGYTIGLFIFNKFSIIILFLEWSILIPAVYYKTKI